MHSERERERERERGGGGGGGGVAGEGREGENEGEITYQRNQCSLEKEIACRYQFPQCAALHAFSITFTTNVDPTLSQQYNSYYPLERRRQNRKRTRLRTLHKHISSVINTIFVVVLEYKVPSHRFKNKPAPVLWHLLILFECFVDILTN